METGNTSGNANYAPERRITDGTQNGTPLNFQYPYGGGGYDAKGTAEHYNTGKIETIEKMARIWGKFATALFCEMNAFKYRERIGHKKEDTGTLIKKIQWYEKKQKELETEMERENTTG